MVWPEFRKLRRVLAPTKSRTNQRKKSKEKKGEESSLRLQQVHPGQPLTITDEGWIETNVEDCQKVICSDKGVKLLLKDGSWSSDDNNHHPVVVDDAHPLKVELERQVAELQLQLAEERHNANREHSQEERNGLRQDLERERLLRMHAESRLEESQDEIRTCKDRLSNLQQDLCKMEEVAKGALQFKSDKMQGEKSSLMLAYQSQLHKYQSCVASLEKENLVLFNELKTLEAMQSKECRESWLSRMLLERVRLLEQENSSLATENEQQRLQYEWCLDDVGRQVVRALVAQKGLREECLQLQRRVRDLESQNLALNASLLTRESIDNQEEKLFFNPFESQQNSSSPSMASQSECSSDSLLSFCSNFSLHSENFGPSCAKMSSPPPLRPSCRSSWTSFLPFLPSPLHDDAKLQLWKRVWASDPPLSSDNLDAMDTPSDDSGSLWWAPSSPSAPPRPNTLNIVPNVIGDPARNFNFPALEKKGHVESACANVYEEVDLPPFPANDSPEEAADTNTVRRVPPPLPPDRPKPKPDESPISVRGSRDEGYSTMSSDVQCDPPSIMPHCQLLSTNAYVSEEIVVSLEDSQLACLRQSSVGLVSKKDVWEQRPLTPPPPFNHRLSSFSEPSFDSSSQVAVHRPVSLDPSYEKIFKLLTPQGFTRNGPHVTSVRTNPLLHSEPLCNDDVKKDLMRTTTCEKSTSMDVEIGLDEEQHVLKSSTNLCTDKKTLIRTTNLQARASSDSLLYKKKLTRLKSCSSAFDLPSLHNQESRAADSQLDPGQNLIGNEQQLEVENRSLVEHWLHTRTNQMQFPYDEEEVGNWSLDLSTEDLSQTHWEEPWDGKEQTNWSAPLFKENDESQSIAKEETAEGKIPESSGGGAEENASSVAEQVATTEAIQTEFNRDFYRLCSVGSVKSLAGEKPKEKRTTRIPVCTTKVPIRKTTQLAKTKRPIRQPIKKVEEICSKEDEPEDSFQLGETVADKIQQLMTLLASSQSEEENNAQRFSPERKYQLQSRVQRKEGCGTSWVHFEADVDLSDPKARANILDSMMASSSSSSSSEGEDEVVEHQHHQRLHALHRFRRHRKRTTDTTDAVISYLPPRLRSSIVDRHDFFYRFGEKEREAVACFDFLDDLSTSPSDAELAPSSSRQQDDRISLSDSCAESYSSSTNSLNRIT